MLRRIPRLLRVAVLVAVLLAVSVSVFQSWSAGLPGAAGWTQTQWGPLGPADRDLLVKVRMAGLWEQPTGQQAVQQASTPEIKEVGRHISEEHRDLDDQVRKVADQLGVLLPTSPSVEQQGWMKEISAQTGSEYDRVLVQRLRQAHGNVLAVIAQVRAGTRNALVRSFADTANQFVSRHIGYLESTGLVDYEQLPTPPSPGLAAGGLSGSDLIVPILVFVAALLAAVGLVLATRRRTSVRPQRTLSTAPPFVPPAPQLAIPDPRRPVDDSVGPLPPGTSPIEATGPRHSLRR